MEASKIFFFISYYTFLHLQMNKKPGSMLMKIRKYMKQVCMLNP